MTTTRCHLDEDLAERATDDDGEMADSDEGAQSR